MPQFLLGEHGVVEDWTPEQVMAAGFDPWRTQLFSEAQVPEQFGDQRFTWSGYGLPGGEALGLDYATGYLPGLLDLRAAVESGQATPEVRQQYAQWVQQARSIPMRDIAGLTYDAGSTGTGTTLSGASPDLGAVMLTLADRIAAGTATDQERALYQTTERALREQDWRANVPQASDAFSPLGDQFMQALTMLSLATGGAGSFGAFGAAGAGAAGAGAGASVLGVPTSTLSTIGTLGGLGGMGTGMLGAALDQPWLQRLATVLGGVGGLAGGTAGIANALSGGISSLGEAGRLLSGAGRVTGALGGLSGQDALRQAAGYLKLTGGLGSTAGGMFEGPGASDFVTQRGTGGPMDFDYSWDYGGETPYWEGVDTTGGWWDDPSGGNFTWTDPTGGLGVGGLSLADQVRQAIAKRPDLYGSAATPGGGTWLSGLTSTLGALSPILGPLLSGAGSLATGGLGASASRDAAGAQSGALNRALALQEAQWLQQQANQAPWLAAGREALGHLSGRSTWGQPTLQQPGLPGTQPFQYRGPEMPGTGFQYTGAGMPAPGFQYTGPGMPGVEFQYTNQMPTQEFTAPTWEALQARDPGIAARLTEARKALEASAAARGGLTSGATLSALQRQAQDLASQEYAPAYGRALGEYQMGYGQDWQRQQEAYQRALAQNQQLYGRQYQQQADIYGRQLGENQQLYNRQWQQQMTDYERQLAQNQLGYGRGMEQYKLGYGQQAALNEQEYARNQALYQQQYQQMVDAYNAQRQAQTQAWNQFASLAGLGQTAVGQLGTQGQAASTQMGSLLQQIGQAQGLGELGPALAWQKGIGGVTNNLTSLLAGLNR